MKPVELRISGWGPYKELQTIDFTRMEERGLFLITGGRHRRTDRRGQDDDF